MVLRNVVTNIALMVFHSATKIQLLYTTRH